MTLHSETAHVIENIHLYGLTHLMWLEVSDLYESASPGQFLMITCGDAEGSFPEPSLGRAMSIFGIRADGGTQQIGILYDVVGRGTRWMSQQEENAEVRILGPLGKGFAPNLNLRNMLLIGGGIGIAPMIWLADYLVDRDLGVTLVHGAGDADKIFPISLLPSDVEFVAVTEDGSMGEKGLVTAPFERLLDWSDQSFACGPDPMLQALNDVRKQHLVDKELQVLMEARMACGFGVCYSCAVFPRNGKKGVELICTDGPMFDSSHVFG
ncbi:MAG: dihydroorotate dehydrogenase electron transfer subunit [Chloroflexota bacterium]|jgi:dihydroorotate dehydrogenase electron transfer subunit|nr:dihydroorotate dehydrogenase electron transfer subunit [Chloroflexota bacterium]|tara:strand:- start:2863 stop:3663 length:801 start_codon:yes stop_codon:yes gene_type:complete